MVELGITVSGHGEAEVVPDRAVIRLGVSVVAPRVIDAVADAASTAAALTSAVVAAGVEAQDIGTSRLSLHPEYDRRPDTDRIAGYRVTHVVEVRLVDVDRAGEIVDVAVTAGGDATLIEGITFEVADPTAAGDRCRANAWRDAEVKARQIAALAGVQIGPAIAVAESAIGGDGDAPMHRAALKSATSVSPGTTRLSVDLTVRFAILHA